MIHNQIAHHGHEAFLPGTSGPDLHSARAASGLWTRAAAALARRDYPEFDRLIMLFKIKTRTSRSGS